MIELNEYIRFLNEALCYLTKNDYRVLKTDYKIISEPKYNKIKYQMFEVKKKLIILCPYYKIIDLRKVVESSHHFKYNKTEFNEDSICIPTNKKITKYNIISSKCQFISETTQIIDMLSVDDINDCIYESFLSDEVKENLINANTFLLTNNCLNEEGYEQVLIKLEEISKSKVKKLFKQVIK